MFKRKNDFCRKIVWLLLIVVDNLCLIVGFSFEGTSGFRGFRPKNVPMVEVVCNGMPVNMELMRHLVSEPTSARAAAQSHVVSETGSECSKCLGSATRRCLLGSSDSQRDATWLRLERQAKKRVGIYSNWKLPGWGWWGSNPSLTRSFLQVDLDCSIHPKLGLCRLSFAAELRLPQSWSEREQRSVWWGAASWSACNTVEGQDTTFWYILIILDEYWLAVSNNPFTFYPFNLDDDPSPSWLWSRNQQPARRAMKWWYEMHWNAKDRNNRVEEVLHLLHIEKCADTAWIHRDCHMQPSPGLWSSWTYWTYCI